jgi:hypothetical protein
MFILLAVLVGITGLFATLWYRTLVGLPASRRPRYSSHRLFKWGVPLGAVSFLMLSFYIIGKKSITALIVFVVGSAVSAACVLRFDRYSAEMRLIYDKYRNISAANPAMEEIEVLFHTAEWRYPAWNQDRLLELVAGKDVEALMVLMMMHENGINPLSDWHLYRRLRARAAGIAGSTRGSRQRRETRSSRETGGVTGQSPR